MKPLTLQQVRAAVAGRSLTPLKPDMPPVTSVSIDSRTIKPQSLFIAIKGDTHDGHDHLRAAHQAGAAAAIVSTEPAEKIDGLTLIHVADTRKALGKLAKAVRKDFTNAKVIAVAGSNGKTGTKGLIDAILKTRLRGSASPKSFNNDIGVPLTLLSADGGGDYVVVELGTNHPGEILPLAEMSSPDIAVITNCSAEHLEGLKDLPGVRKENAAVTLGMTPKSLLIVPGDDANVMASVATFKGRKLTFGTSKTSDLFATDITADGQGVRFHLNGSRLEIALPLLGKHNALNALAAIGVARRLGIPDEHIVAGLAHATGPEMRLACSEHNGVRVINDAYNANPASMLAALDVLASLEGRKVAVLGQMNELGDTSERYHRDVGTAAAKVGLHKLITVGDGGRVLADAAKAAGMSADSIESHDDAASVAAVLPPMLQAGDVVLLKGSRTIALEKVAAAIASR
jgi:UDP-N-acetylmuramoyl-tripeptide--D-alanyl-D-alanine ligase